MGFYGHVGHVGQTFFVFFRGLGWGANRGFRSVTQCSSRVRRKGEDNASEKTPMQWHEGHREQVLTIFFNKFFQGPQGGVEQSPGTRMSTEPNVESNGK